MRTMAEVRAYARQIGERLMIEAATQEDPVKVAHSRGGAKFAERFLKWLDEGGPSQPDSLNWNPIVAPGGKAMVQVLWGDKGGALTPDEAREEAMALMDIAGIAEEDAVLYRWLERMFTDQSEGEKLARIGEVLSHFRAIRTEMRSRREMPEMRMLDGADRPRETPA